MDKISFKIPFFITILLFGAVTSGWNWILAFVCAIIVSFSLEIGLAYDKGKKDGRREYLDEEERLKEQDKYLKRMEKEEEAENMQKLKSAKTGQPITISRSYGVIGSNGEDDGKRFVRKEDADKYLKQQSQQNKK